MSVSLLQIPQLRELEEKYARILGPGVLMERAGKAAADFISDLYPAPARVTVVCGPGNNGGDGYRTAIELLKKEYNVNVVQVAGKTPKSAEAKAALAEWEKLGRTTYTDPYDTPKAVLWWMRFSESVWNVRLKTNSSMQQCGSTKDEHCTFLWIFLPV